MVLKRASPETHLSLNCKGLTKLPELPPHINQFVTLPELPKGLTHLYCNNNYLTTLPELPPTLTHLYCSYNNIVTLPELPKSLIELSCYGNPLPEIPKGYTSSFLYTAPNK